MIWIYYIVFYGLLGAIRSCNRHANTRLFLVQLSYHLLNKPVRMPTFRAKDVTWLTYYSQELFSELYRI